MYILKKQLDELMGPERNGSKPVSDLEGFYDGRVCKLSLVGLCPYKLFPNTKQDLGSCPYSVCPVPENLIKEYKTERENQDYGYERDAISFYQRMVNDCDDNISRARDRLNLRKQAAEPERLADVTKEMDELTEKVEKLGEEGDIDQAEILLKRIEGLKQEKEVLEGKATASKEQQLIVCDVCGALLSVNESDQRLADHFAGKIHSGYKQLRDKLKELKTFLKTDSAKPSRYAKFKESFRKSDRHSSREHSSRGHFERSRRHEDGERSGSFRGNRHHSDRHSRHGSHSSHGSHPRGFRNSHGPPNGQNRIPHDGGIRKRYPSRDHHHQSHHQHQHHRRDRTPH